MEQELLLSQVQTVFIHIEIWAFIPYQVILTWHLFEPILHSAFYIGTYIRVLYICDYLGPDVYTSSAFIHINPVN